MPEKRGDGLVGGEAVWLEGRPCGKKKIIEGEEERDGKRGSRTERVRKR